MNSFYCLNNWHPTAKGPVITKQLSVRINPFVLFCRRSYNGQ